MAAVTGDVGPVSFPGPLDIDTPVVRAGEPPVLRCEVCGGVAIVGMGQQVTVYGEVDLVVVDEPARPLCLVDYTGALRDAMHAVRRAIDDAADADPAPGGAR